MLSLFWRCRLRLCYVLIMRVLCLTKLRLYQVCGAGKYLNMTMFSSFGVEIWNIYCVPLKLLICVCCSVFWCCCGIRREMGNCKGMCFWMMNKFWHWVGTGAKCSYVIQKEMIAITFIVLYPGWIILLLVFLWSSMCWCTNVMVILHFSWNSCDWIVALFGWSELLLHGTVFYFSISCLCNISSTHVHTQSKWFLVQFLFIFYNTVRHILCLFVCLWFPSATKPAPWTPNLLDIWSYCRVKISLVPFKWFLEWHFFF